MASLRSLPRVARDVLTVGLLAVVGVGCSPPSAVRQLPPAVESTKVYGGDELEIAIVGEEKVPKAFTVASDGTIDAPLIRRIKVGGLEPQEVAALIRQRLVEEQILLDPSVSVRVTQYKSKRVEVNGQVARATSVSLEPGMTVLRAITLAGGFAQMADKNKIKLRRRTAKGIEEFNLNEGDSYSVVLQAGDSIDVGQSVF